MNPYLEQRWGDVHTRLASYAADSLQERLPDALRARMQERVFIESTDEVLPYPRRGFSPDVHVYEVPSPELSAPGSDAGLAIEAEPIIIHLPETEVIEAYIEILDISSGGRVVTTIEFISRSNKRPGRGRRDYLRKRSDTIKARASVVEIDLLRGGRPVTLAAPVLPMKSVWRTPYHACVHRAAKPEQIEYYPVPLRTRLPVIRVPLRATDADVTLDLQGLIDEAYRKGRYDDIDYAQPLRPALSADDAAWAAQLVR
jgi:hypothetical protein